jgi:hypothetical protein
MREKINLFMAIFKFKKIKNLFINGSFVLNSKKIEIINENNE